MQAAMGGSTFTIPDKEYRTNQVGRSFNLHLFGAGCSPEPIYYVGRVVSPLPLETMQQSTIGHRSHADGYPTNRRALRCLKLRSVAGARRRSQAVFSGAFRAYSAGRARAWGACTFRFRGRTPRLQAQGACPTQVGLWPSGNGGSPRAFGGSILYWSAWRNAHVGGTGGGPEPRCLSSCAACFAGGRPQR